MCHLHILLSDGVHLMVLPAIPGTTKKPEQSTHSWLVLLLLINSFCTKSTYVSTAPAFLVYRDPVAPSDSSLEQVPSFPEVGSPRVTRYRSQPPSSVGCKAYAFNGDLVGGSSTVMNCLLPFLPPSSVGCKAYSYGLVGGCPYSMYWLVLLSAGINRHFVPGP